MNESQEYISDFLLMDDFRIFKNQNIFVQNIIVLIE